MSNRFRYMGATLAGCMVTTQAMAVLLQHELSLPLLNFNNTGVLVYDASSDLLAVDAQPVAMLISDTQPPVQFQSGDEVSIRVLVDATGQLQGGVPGNDLQVIGTIDLGALGVFDGVLLTGEVLAFGSRDSGGPTDQFDFRFSVTGGLLADLYGDEVGVALTSEGSTFSAGDFSVGFGGAAKGNVGGVPSMLGCRFTGGGVDTDQNWDHTLESGEMVRNGAGHLPPGIDRYQFGGQAGANTGSPPQPSGEWTHHQQTGPSGSFTFHGGTSSAPAGTEIDAIRCSDPGYCAQARPAPTKQLDFDGIGTFRNLGKGNKAPAWAIPNATLSGEGGGKTFRGTYHWFEVNIDDLGEPGRFNAGAPDSETCPGRGFGEKSAGLHVPDPVSNPGDQILLPDSPLAECDCPDFYRITIYDGTQAADVTVLPDGTIDPSSLDRSTVIYEAYGYIDGGNLQIHPPTGFDTN